MLLKSTNKLLLHRNIKETDVSLHKYHTTQYYQIQQWCSQPLRNADLYTSCTVLIGGCCILMPILVIILHCLGAGSSGRLGSDRFRARMDYLLQQEGPWVLSVRNTRRESVPITNLLKPFMHSDLQTDPDTKTNTERRNRVKLPPFLIPF